MIERSLGFFLCLLALPAVDCGVDGRGGGGGGGGGVGVDRVILLSERTFESSDSDGEDGKEEDDDEDDAVPSFARRPLFLIGSAGIG